MISMVHYVNDLPGQSQYVGPLLASGQLQAGQAEDQDEVRCNVRYRETVLVLGRQDEGDLGEDRLRGRALLA